MRQERGDIPPIAPTIQTSARSCCQLCVRYTVEYAAGIVHNTAKPQRCLCRAGMGWTTRLGVASSWALLWRRAVRNGDDLDTEDSNDGMHATICAMSASIHTPRKHYIRRRARRAGTVGQQVIQPMPARPEPSANRSTPRWAGPSPVAQLEDLSPKNNDGGRDGVAVQHRMPILCDRLWRPTETTCSRPSCAR